MGRFTMAELIQVPIHVSGRAKPHSFMYFRMCCDALVHYRLLRASHEDINLLDPRFLEKSEILEMASVMPIVFAGMCLEATLFDLAACLFGDEFAEGTDRLDPLGKFVVLTQCVDRETPSKSNVTYQAIKELVAARNRLVHYRSQRFPEKDIDTFMDRAAKLQRQQRAAIDTAFRALVLLSIHFDGNIFEELNILPCFKKPEYWQSEVPEELHADVYRCIAATERARRRPSESAAP